MNNKNNLGLLLAEAENPTSKTNHIKTRTTCGKTRTNCGKKNKKPIPNPRLPLTLEPALLSPCRLRTNNDDDKSMLDDIS